MSNANEPDWKAIALELARRVNFAVSHLKANGSGLVGSIHEPSENWKPWRDLLCALRSEHAGDFPEHTRREIDALVETSPRQAAQAKAPGTTL